MSRQLNAAPVVPAVDRMTNIEAGAPATPAAPAAQATAAPAPFSTEQLAQLLEAFGSATPVQAAAAEAPAVPDPFAGAARVQVGEEPEVYRPGGEFSFVRDAYNARFNGDEAAAARFNKWQRQLAAFAVDGTRANNPEVIPPGYRGDLLVEPDVPSRPIGSRLRTINLTDATPFAVPIRGAAAVVGDHVEGTAHVASGTLTVDTVAVTPKAVSGAYEISRELIDSSNPAIDQLAWRSILEEYDAKAEAYTWARIIAAQTDLAGATKIAALTPVASIDTDPEYRAQLLAFWGARNKPASFAAVGLEMFTKIDGFADSTGRPLYPEINPANASGNATSSDVEYGLNVRGVPHVLSNAGGVNGADQSLLIRSDDILLGESGVRQFRFEEVSGPGIIKLALWAYIGVARFRSTGAMLVDIDATNP